jgi:polar amino acid transport system permease protein
MTYQIEFSNLLQYTLVLVKGVGLTAALITVGGVSGVAVGVFGAWARGFSRISWLAALVGAYVELIRNTPFLVQILFIYFGLPSAGIHLSAVNAALLAIILNLGAYATEIIRAGVEAVPISQIEAAASQGMSRRQIFGHVVLQPALQTIWPALTSQLVIVMFGSAVCSIIAVEELTFAASFIQSRSFRAFEVYFVATGIYFALALFLRQGLRLLGRVLIYQRVP